MWRKLANLILLILTGLLSSRLPAAEEVSGELVGLNVSLTAEKQLLVFEELVSSREWNAAIDLLDRLSVDSVDTLVKASPGRYVGLQVAIQRRLSQLPPAGLDVYRKRINSVATSTLNQAREEHSSILLWRLANSMAAIPASQSALEDLAGQAASRGDLELALRLWERLLSSSESDTRLSPPSLLSTPLSDSEHKQAIRRKVALTRQLLGLPLDTAEVDSRGAVLRSDGLPVTTPEGPQKTHESPLTRSGPDFGPVRWSLMTTANCPFPEFQTPLALTAGRTGLLILNNGWSIRAIQTDSGKPRWPTNLPDDTGLIWEDPDSPNHPDSVVYCRMGGGVCFDERYFGVVTDAPYWRVRPGLTPLSGSLVALNVSDGEGRLEWRVEARDLPEPNWLFHGAPSIVRGALPGDDLVVVPICRPDSQVELALIAFHADDGRLAWWTRTGTSAAEAGMPIPATQILSRAGLIIARTLTGVVLAIDPLRGQIQWASTAMVSSPPTSHGSPAPLLDVQSGRLVVGNPTRSRIEPPRVACFSLDSGEELWRQEISFPIQGVICARPDHVLVAGSRLRAILLRDGRTIWEQGTDDPIDAGSGVPVVYNSTVVWPTRTGLWGFDLLTGAIDFKRRITIEPISQPVSLLPLMSHWVIARPDTLLCLPDSSAIHP